MNFMTIVLYCNIDHCCNVLLDQISHGTVHKRHRTAVDISVDGCSVNVRCCYEVIIFLWFPMNTNEQAGITYPVNE